MANVVFETHYRLPFQDRLSCWQVSRGFDRFVGSLNRWESHVKKCHRDWSFIRNWICAHPSSARAIFCRWSLQSPLTIAADLAREILSGAISGSADGRDRN